MTVEVEKWVTYDDEAHKDLRDIGIMGGFFQDGMRWNDYLENCPVPEYAEAIRRSVLASGDRFCGDEHQNGDNRTPLFSDGAIGTFSYRAWGDLMAAIWSTHDERDYNYMDFYCCGVSPRAQGKS